MSICILHVASRIRRSKESSLKKERTSLFISFIFEKDVLHKYVDPNTECKTESEITKLGI